MSSHPWSPVFLICICTIGLLYIPVPLLSLCRRSDSHVSLFLSFICGLLFVPALKYALLRLTRVKHDLNSNRSVYGLDHGRLHVRETSFWLNMGFWHNSESTHEAAKDQPDTLAKACRALLCEVFKTAGLSRQAVGTSHSFALLDLGFGCGDQTVYMMSPSPIRDSDKDWWHIKPYIPRFDAYIGITLDWKQLQCARDRLEELKGQDFPPDDKWKIGIQNTSLFCADAAKPELWSDELKEHLRAAFSQVDECWVLALDTLYHFSPSRWAVINFASHDLNASFMAFDLCISDSISYFDRVLLRILTKLMGAPWTNFVTIDEYREKLSKAGYLYITIRDISGHVFAPLTAFLGEQDQRLSSVGYGLGPFHLARWMFGWWARTGIVRGVIVVARQR